MSRDAAIEMKDLLDIVPLKEFRVSIFLSLFVERIVDYFYHLYIKMASSLITKINAWSTI